MTEFTAYETGDLHDMVHLLDKEKDRNRFERLNVLHSMDQQGNETGQVLWRILSHPHCKVNFLNLEANYLTDPDITFTTLTALRRWCQEIPAKHPRAIEVLFRSTVRTKGGDEYDKPKMPALEDLRQALQSPHNGVQKLVLCGTFSDWRLCELVLNPVLQHPNNEVTELALLCTQFLDSEAKALSKALASPYLKVRAFRIGGTNLTFDEAMSLLEGLEGLRWLERVEWDIRTVRYRHLPGRTSFPLSKEEKIALTGRIAGLVVRPGNVIRTFRLSNEEWDSEHASIVANALGNENCRVEELHCALGSLIIADAVFRCHQRMKVLEMSILDDKTAEVFEHSLRDRACPIESLVMPCCTQRVALAMANMLNAPNCSRLRMLKVGRQSPAVFLAFTESLRSHNNHLQVLFIFDDDTLDEGTRHDFYRALRTSNVRIVKDALFGPYHPFTMTFNDPFFLVLHTLLSTKHVLRLAQFAWVRVLPVQDFILRIADTLGWPLDDLRAPFDPPTPSEL